jgi:hypothetical protein
MKISLTRAAIIILLVVSGSITGCASRVTQVHLPAFDQKQAFSAARAVLQDRFQGLRRLDPERGLLISDYKSSPAPAVSARFYARVEVGQDGQGASLHVRVVTEQLAFEDMQVVWVETGRNASVETVEGYIVEEIKARLEGRKPDLPELP